MKDRNVRIFQIGKATIFDFSDVFGKESRKYHPLLHIPMHPNSTRSLAYKYFTKSPKGGN